MGQQVISLFSGCGGLDCGMTAAGFETVVSLDFDPICAASLVANGCGEVFAREISRISAIDLMSAAGADIGEIDLIMAGPPCQPFSKSANWRYGSPLGLEDPRSASLTHMMRIIEGLLPKVVLIENVQGFGGNGVRAGLQFVERKFAKINKKQGVAYKLSSAILDAADYGVPQHRRRLLMVFDREGREFKMPKPTHGPECAYPFITAWDGIGDLDFKTKSPELKVRGKWADLLPSIPEGENYLWHTDRGNGSPLFGYRTRYWSFLLKLSKNRPAWTLPASPSQNTGPFHWKNRLLSAAEIARLQSFSDAWHIEGTRAQQVRQLGNAVPPLLAEVIGREIRKQLLGARLKHDAPILLRERAARTPPAQRATPIDRKYLALIGSHRPHPGHGQGPGALRRALELAEAEQF